MADNKDWYKLGMTLGEDVVDKFEDQTDLVESMRFDGLPSIGSTDEAAFIDGFILRMRQFVASSLNQAPDELRTGEPLV